MEKYFAYKDFFHLKHGEHIMAKISKKRQAENREKWLAALESGEYKQGKNNLHTKKKKYDYFCCLGVACDLAIKSGVKLKTEEHPDDDGKCTVVSYGPNQSTGFLPHEIMNWLGFVTENGNILYHRPNDACSYTNLAELNDSGKYTFRKIAKIARERMNDLTNGV